MVLPHFRVHRAGIGGAGRRFLRCGGRRHSSRLTNGVSVVSVVSVVVVVAVVAMRNLPFGHQVHLALGAAPRMVLPHFRVHRAGVGNCGTSQSWCAIDGGGSIGRDWMFDRRNCVPFAVRMLMRVVVHTRAFVNSGLIISLAIV